MKWTSIQLHDNSMQRVKQDISNNLPHCDWRLQQLDSRKINFTLWWKYNTLWASNLHPSPRPTHQEHVAAAYLRIPKCQRNGGKGWAGNGRAAADFKILSISNARRMPHSTHIESAMVISTLNVAKLHWRQHPAQPKLIWPWGGGEDTVSQQRTARTILPPVEPDGAPAWVRPSAGEPWRGGGQEVVSLWWEETGNTFVFLLEKLGT